MFFPESERTARDNPDLARVIKEVDRHLSGIGASAPLRPSDFACMIGAELNQVDSVFSLLAGMGVLTETTMVECESCQVLASADALRKAIRDEDPFECSGCGAVFSRRARPVLVYRLSEEVCTRTRASAKSAQDFLAEIRGANTEAPLSERAIEVLVAMLALGAVDSDSRRSTEEIAAKATGGDANSLKVVMADLKKRQLIDSKTGRSGGCWLTAAGLARAKKLHNRSVNSATV